MSTQPRVVVTGLGASTPVGGDAASTWEGLLSGRSGVSVIDERWADELPVRIAAQVAVDPRDVLERVEARRLDRTEQLALIAAREAWADAGTPDVDKERLGVVVATGIGGAQTLLSQWDTLREKGPRSVSPHTIPMLMPNGPAAYVGLEFSARAGVHTPVSACASGAEAVAYALQMIRTGRADIVVAGGTEACLHPVPMAAFAAMMALSRRNDEPERASRPYDKGRDGFVFGEGAGILVLESEEHARARGVRIYAEVAGSGITSDGHHIAQPDPVGAGASRAMRMALDRRRRHPRRDRARQRARDLDPAGRRRRGDGDPCRARRRRRPRRRLRHQVDDRSPARAPREQWSRSPWCWPSATGWRRRPSTSRTLTTR